MLTDQQIKDNLIKRPKNCFGQCNRKDEICYESDEVMCSAFDDCAILAKLKTKDYDPETSPIEHATFQWADLPKKDKIKIELEIDIAKNEKKETNKSSKARASTEEPKKEENNEDDALINSLDMNDEDDLDLNSEVDSLVNEAEKKDQDDISLEKELEDEDLDLEEKDDPDLGLEEAKEKEAEEKREAKEKEAEEKREAKEKEAEEKREAKEKEAEKKREAKEKEAEKKREAKEKHIVSKETVEVNSNKIKTLSISEIKELIDYAIGKVVVFLQGDNNLANKECGNRIKLETQELAPKKKKQADAPPSTKNKAGGRGRPAGAKNKKKAQ